VEQRQHADLPVGRLETVGHDVHRLAGVRREVAVGELDAFRLAGRPRRVRLHRHVVVRAVRDRVVAVGEELPERRPRVGLTADGDDVLDARVVSYLLHERYEVGERDDHLGLRVLEEVTDLPALVLGVHRHDHGPSTERAVERRDELREVREVHRHPVALTDPSLPQPGGELAGLPPEFAVRELVVLVDDRWLPGVLFDRRLNVRNEIRHVSSEHTARTTKYVW
jgi:hypothetical protein